MKNGAGNIRRVADLRAQNIEFRGYYTRVCVYAVVCALALWYLVPRGAVAATLPAPVAPLIFEKPNSERFEVVWFHPAFHSYVIGNLQKPSRYFTIYSQDREGIVASRISLAAPFAVHRVTA